MIERFNSINYRILLLKFEFKDLNKIIITFKSQSFEIKPANFFT